MAGGENRVFLDENAITWPCPACGARSVKAAYRRCLDETGHNDCGHDVMTTPCPMDDLLEKTD